MERLGSFILDQWLLFLALVIILILLLINLTKHRVLGFSEIRPDRAVFVINHDDAVVIDARKDEDFVKGHIVNAINLPLATLEARIGELEPYRGRPLLVYCNTGRHSAHASASLYSSGFKPVYKLAGGLRAWERAGLPLTQS